MDKMIMRTLARSIDQEPTYDVQHFSSDSGLSGTGEMGWDKNDCSNAGSSQSSSKSQRKGRRCQMQQCTKGAQNGQGGVYCRAHGGGRRCTIHGCGKVDVGGGFCRGHGGGKRCTFEQCNKTDIGGGRCMAHGGGKRCIMECCGKGAQAGGLLCKAHGGGRRCTIAGCTASGQSGQIPLCIKHGGGKRCTAEGCTNLVRKGAHCARHYVRKLNQINVKLPRNDCRKCWKLEFKLQYSQHNVKLPSSDINGTQHSTQFSDSIFAQPLTMAPSENQQPDFQFSDIRDNFWLGNEYDEAAAAAAQALSMAKRQISGPGSGGASALEAFSRVATRVAEHEATEPVYSKSNFIGAAPKRTRTGLNIFDDRDDQSDTMANKKPELYISLAIEGMMCMQNCGETVRQCLAGIPGVLSVTVHFPTRTASVQLDSDSNTGIDTLIKSLEAVGFQASCITSCTSEKPLMAASENAVWAIAEVLGLVDHGCPMSWGEACSCDPYKCRCTNCDVHAALREDLKIVFEGCALAQQQREKSSETST